MSNLFRSRNFYLMLIFDAALVVLAHFLSYFLRFEGKIPAPEWVTLKSTIPYLIAFKLIVFFIFDLYKGMWRYTGLVDLLNVLKATTISSSGLIMAVLFLHRFQGFPRSVFIVDWLLTFIFIGGLRVVIRLLLSESEGFQFLIHNPFKAGAQRHLRKRLLIIGAGNTGEKMLREIRDNHHLNSDLRSQI